MTEQSNLGAFVPDDAEQDEENLADAPRNRPPRRERGNRRELRTDERECRTCGLRYLPDDPDRARCNICIKCDGPDADAVTD